MATLFEDWHRILAPKWLRDGMGDFWLRAVGQQKDRIEQYARDFILSRFPDYAAVDSLRIILSDRLLEPPFGVDVYGNLAVWRAKAKQAFQRWVFGGTHYGLLREEANAQCGSAFGSALVIGQIFDELNVRFSFQNLEGTADLSGFSQTETSSFATGPTALSFKGGITIWNSFALVLRVSQGTHPWHGGVPNDASPEAEQCRRIVNRWRAGHALCADIIVIDFSDVDGTSAVLWGISLGDGDVFPPVWGNFTWGSTGGAGASVTHWTPPTQ